MQLKPKPNQTPQCRLAERSTGLWISQPCQYQPLLQPVSSAQFRAKCDVRKMQQTINSSQKKYLPGCSSVGIHYLCNPGVQTNTLCKRDMNHPPQSFKQWGRCVINKLTRFRKPGQFHIKETVRRVHPQCQVFAVLVLILCLCRL